MKMIVTLLSTMLMTSVCYGNSQEIEGESINIVKNQQVILPLSIVNHGPHVECKINGKKAIMMIDTGTPGVCLFNDRFKKFGINVIGMTKSDVHTAAESMKFEVADKMTLTFAEAIVAQISHPIILPIPSHFLADGLIGSGFLAALNGTIDFRSNTIVLGEETIPKEGILLGVPNQNPR